MADQPQEGTEIDACELELAADEAILACGGDAREAVKALVVANAYLEDELAKISYGYARGKVGGRREAG